ncbi:MAG: hypothetical protein M1497_06045 [Nitrospirae bacterium]|nr:hypothetical protein [Nitrospirota bacterium]
MKTSHRYHDALKQERLQRRREAGLVSERFPDVLHITVELTYFWKETKTVLLLRTLNFLPDSYAYFRLECLGERCGEGEFDLEQVISAMVGTRTRSGKGEIASQGNSAFPGHVDIRYKVAIEYRRHHR